MQIDISEIVSCENREVTEKVHIEQDTFVSRLGEFPITESAPFDLRIANREGAQVCGKRTLGSHGNSVYFVLVLKKVLTNC